MENNCLVCWYEISVLIKLIPIVIPITNTHFTTHNTFPECSNPILFSCYWFLGHSEGFLRLLAGPWSFSTGPRSILKLFQKITPLPIVPDFHLPILGKILAFWKPPGHCHSPSNLEQALFSQILAEFGWISSKMMNFHQKWLNLSGET